MKKVLLSVALAAATLASISAQASVVISIGNSVTAANALNYAVDPYSGKTTNRTGLVFVETFDNPGAPGSGPGGLRTPAEALAAEAISASKSTGTANCGLTTAAIVTGGTYGYTNGSTTSSAKPKDDSTCYAFGPGTLGALPAGSAPNLSVVTVDYSNLLVNFPGKGLDYFGLYYGSIDTYNQLQFFSGANGTGTLVETVTGQQILNACGISCVSGDQNSEYTNVYVNLDFTLGSEFKSFKFMTTQIAVEVDNLAVGINQTNMPEPASLALMGLGLAALGLSRRKQSK